MYDQANLTDRIERVIPSLHATLHTAGCERSVYKQVDALSHYVADKACDDEMGAVKRALYLVDDLYQEGSSAVKGAIENVFVFSLTGTLARMGSRSKSLLGLIPITLFTVYVNQVLHKGC